MNTDELFEKACLANNNGLWLVSARLFRQLIELKDIRAFSWLADQYQHGKGVSQSQEKAIELYLKAIALGDADAAFNLGACYLSGHHGIDQDSEKGIHFMKLAEELGSELDIQRILDSYHDRM
ncbi:tetratricopeptide repeat protein [Gimesia chilikensis]|uniref:tetratricopeptide repeat protein n=1 Tax=Gimesia chilikensis TaxID=2605989 RepID=UPI001188A251|nr:tetratricopeptide repeat protein [Gimesia chilikensis]QDT86393.1 Sel1 repeat protein [Gimesia chilikensis]